MNLAYALRSTLHGVDRHVVRANLNVYKQYFTEDNFKLSHFGTWRLTFNGRLLITESDPSFWDIVEAYSFKAFIDCDTAGEDTAVYEIPIEDLERDTNFLPSIMGEYESPSGAGHKSLRRLLGFVA